MKAPSLALVGLGSNLGDRQGFIQGALERLGGIEGIEIVRVSPLVETHPQDVCDQPDFLNGAASLKTSLSALDLLASMLDVEAALGRVRTVRRGPRTVDLDLLFYDQKVLVTPELVLPHPRLHMRSFVLDPLSRIAPGFRHPVLGRTVEELRRLQRRMTTSQSPGPQQKGGCTQ
jgi:2-amino-4-hydroxy-6-hydroxymethyldihydropteridine diphosphokinase